MRYFYIVLWNRWVCHGIFQWLLQSLPSLSEAWMKFQEHAVLHSTFKWWLFKQTLKSVLMLRKKLRLSQCTALSRLNIHLIITVAALITWRDMLLMVGTSLGPVRQISSCQFFKRVLSPLRIVLKAYSYIVQVYSKKYATGMNFFFKRLKVASTFFPQI